MDQALACDPSGCTCVTKCDCADLPRMMECCLLGGAGAVNVLPFRPDHVETRRASFVAALTAHAAAEAMFDYGVTCPRCAIWTIAVRRSIQFCMTLVTNSLCGRLFPSTVRSACAACSCFLPRADFPASAA